MIVTFLAAEVPLSKSYTIQNKKVIKSPYPHITYFTSAQETINDITAFHAAITAHAAQGNCLLKGQLNRPLKHESRAGSTDADGETEWVCLDIDGLQGFASPQDVMGALGLGDITHIVQWSASAGIEAERGMSCHIFFLLDAPVRAPILKQWLMHLNLSTALQRKAKQTETVAGKTKSVEKELTTYPLREQIKLTRTGAALRWPLDITVCQNDKLIYISPPTLGEGVRCSVQPKNRIRLVKRTLDKAPGSRVQFAALSTTLEEARKLRDELRASAGMPKLKTGSLKWEHSMEVQRAPGRALVTGCKTDRGFTYLNLNGGDSWGYYHPEGDAKYLFNFKGEPTYLIAELLPEYHAAWLERHRQANSAAVTGIEHFVLCDPSTGKYHKGYYDLQERRLQLWHARSEKQVQDYLKQNNLPEVDPIPDWTLAFDPHNKEVFNRATRFINRYRMPETLESALRSRSKPKDDAHWPTIRRIISSAVADTGDVYDHFMNWLACLVQHRTKLQTAWILHGVPGTGKGLLVDRVLAPIIGPEYVTRKTQSALLDTFNGYLETSLLVYFDEMKQLALGKSADPANEQLKNWITEPVLDIRAMYENARNVRNYASFILSSNQPDVWCIDPHDRRFNVANYQEGRLIMAPGEVERITLELPAFAQYLARREADMARARSIIHTEAREHMQKLTRNAADMVADALNAKDFEYFFDSLPDPNSKMDPFSETAIAGIAYTEWFTSVVRELSAGERTSKLTREDLFVIFNYLVGDTPKSPNKFTSYLKHRRIHMSRLRISGDRDYGYAVKWRVAPELLAMAERMLTKTPPLKAVRGGKS